jgi:hypothetical protein
MIPGHRSTGNRRGSNHPVLFLVTGILACSPAFAGDVSWEGGVTVVVQDTDNSRADSELTASADLLAMLTQERGAWMLYIEASSSPGSNGVSAFYPTAMAMRVLF